MDMENNPAADPTCIRVGEAPENADVLIRTASEAEAVVSRAQYDARKPVSLEDIEEALLNVKGAVMIAYPMELPEHDIVRQILEGEEDLSGTQASEDEMDPDTCVLWFAGKKMSRDQPLSKYSGNNNKVKLKVKITGKSSGPPQRQRVDGETQKKMMAMWHKKQQQAKELEEDDDDAFLNSEWANPRAFKQRVHGAGNIRWG